jgi:hypothetical protein
VEVVLLVILRFLLCHGRAVGADKEFVVTVVAGDIGRVLRRIGDFVRR